MINGLLSQTDPGFLLERMGLCCLSLQILATLHALVCDMVCTVRIEERRSCSATALRIRIGDQQPARKE
jgi:hypothetical protein